MNEPDDGWIPRISCQACGASWALKEEIQHDCTDHYECPDCDYSTVHPTGTEMRCGRHSEHGSQPFLGIAGVHGPSIVALDPWGLPQIGVSTTPDDGLNSFQGRLVDISSPWSAEREGEFTLMVFFDSQTHRRLVESLYGEVGSEDMGVAESCPMTVILEQPST